MAWVGIIARNEKGEVLTGMSKKFPASSPLMAEALGFREALAFADSLGMRCILVENDNLELIQACRNEMKRGEILNVVKDISTLKGNFQMAGVTWISREGNRPAHHLAQLAKRGCLPSNWSWNPPLSLKSLLVADRNLAISDDFPFDPGSGPNQTR